MRVQVVDPAAQTPPYDHSLCTALAKAGADVELLTSSFVHGDRPSPENYAVREDFYRHSARMQSGTLGRRLTGLVEHVPAMRRHRRSAADADVVHYQWLTLPGLDARLLPEGPKVLTAHGFLRPSESRGAGVRRALARMDTVVALSQFGAGLLAEAGVPDDRIEVIPHGVLDYLTRLPFEQPLPPELGDPGDRRVVLSFGLIRPYKGVDVLLRAFAEIEDPGAELWIVGRPLGVDIDELRLLADERVRFVPRFIADDEVAQIFRRADVVALPYREADQSGVLFTALAFSKAIVASSVGGFPEVAARDAAVMVEPGDVQALATTLSELISDPVRRDRLEAAATAAAHGPYSWSAVAEAHLALYRRLTSR